MTTLPLSLARTDVRRAFLGNLAASSGESAMRFLLGLALARLLRPAELGLFAMATAVFGIAQLLRDFGVSAYLQRESALTPRRFSACLGLLACTTLAVLLALLLLAEPLSALLGQPGLAPLLRVLAFGLPVSAFGSVMAALQLRELAAARIAKVSWLGVAIQGVVALSRSVEGAGALGLAWAQVGATVACALAYAGWRPLHLPWRPAWQGWGEVLRFGGASLLATGLAGLHAALPDLLLGRMGAPHQLGLLGRAQATVSLLQVVAGQALNFGALPLLSDRHARGQALAPVLQRVTALLTGLGWPLLALTVAYREPLVRLLYGPAWLGCTPAVLPLALVAALALAFTQFGAALAAVGRPELAAWPTATSLVARMAFGLLLFDGSLASFAWALCAAAAVALPVQLGLAARHLGLPPRALLGAVGGSALATLAVLAVPLSIAPLAWLAALRWARHPLLDEALQLLVRRRMTSRK
jgi:O-antigen/teichoic acid export membrane protein